MDDGVLYKTNQDTYGSEYNNHLLEQYKLYVEMADRVSIRRASMHRYFLTVNTALLAFAGVAREQQLVELPKQSVLVVAAAGVLLCYIWYRLVRSYKDLNTGKFKVVHALEAKLPAALFDAEWEVLGKGKDKKLYLPFTHIEIWIPWIFVVLHVIVALWVISPWATHLLTNSILQ